MVRRGRRGSGPLQYDGGAGFLDEGELGAVLRVIRQRIDEVPPGDVLALIAKHGKEHLSSLRHTVRRKQWDRAVNHALWLGIYYTRVEAYPRWLQAEDS